MVESPYRDLTTTVVEYLEQAARRAGNEAPCSTWSSPSSWSPPRLGKLLHNQSALWIRAALYAHPRVAVTSVPWVLEDTPADGPAAAG